MTVIGVDLGGTKLACARFSASGEILERDVVPLDEREGPEVGALVAERVARLRESGEAEAVGVAVPGIYAAARGRVWAPNIPGWDDYPLREELGAAVGEGVEVAVDSDRACYILGEAWRGAARGCRDAIFVAVGTGIGAGILVDGRVLRGARDIAGATGWLALERPYRADFDTCGCFESQASGPGLAAEARRRLGASPGHAGPLAAHDPERLTAADVFAAYDAGDAIAREAVGNAVELWGMAVANLASLFDPEMIVFGGGVFGPAARLLDQIRDEALRWAQPISMPQVRLEATRLGGEAGLYGAGQLALRAAAATRHHNEG